MVRAQCFLCRSVGSASGILQARWFGQKKILKVGWAVSGIVQASLQKEDTPAQTEVVIRDQVTPQRDRWRVMTVTLLVPRRHPVSPAFHSPPWILMRLVEVAFQSASFPLCWL